MQQEIILHFRDGNPLHIWLTEEEFESDGATQDRVIKECDALNIDTNTILRIEIGRSDETDTEGLYFSPSMRGALNRRLNAAFGGITVGTIIRLSEEALENYGEKWRGKTFSITHVADHCVPSQAFFDERSSRYREEGGHPGYDEGVSPMLLVDVEGFPGSLYEWEFEVVDTREGEAR